MNAFKESCRRGYNRKRSSLGGKVSCAEAGLALKGTVQMRMLGEAVPVYTVSGSGNTGLSLTLPLVFSPFGGEKKEKLFRAFILGSLVNSRVRDAIGNTGPLCSAYIAGGAGLCAAYSFLAGADLKVIGAGAALFILSAQGVFCNGAGPLCSMKLSTMPALAYNCSSASAGNSGCNKRGSLCLEEVLKGLGQLMKERNLSLNRDIAVMMNKFYLPTHPSRAGKIAGNPAGLPADEGFCGNLPKI